MKNKTTNTKQYKTIANILFVNDKFKKTASKHYVFDNNLYGSVSKEKYTRVDVAMTKTISN